MNLLKDIRDDLLDPAAQVSGVLRKALVLAFELRNEDLTQWVNYELGGYPDGVKVPSYRLTGSLFSGDFVGPYWQLKNQSIPNSALPAALRKLRTETPMTQPTSYLEAAVARDDNFLVFPAPAGLAQHLSGGVFEDAVCTSAIWVVNKMQVARILDGIKTRLLNFILELQHAYPELARSEETLSKIPRSGVTMAIINNIYGNQDSVASGSNFQQNTHQQVTQGDFSTLATSLEYLGVSDEELQALKVAIEEDGLQEPPRFGLRVKAWLGAALQKAIDGAYKVGVDTAPAIITKALCAYYGWPQGEG